jgi:type I restriction enzyme S subunit
VSGLPPNWVLARVGDLVELGPKNDCPDDTEVGFVPLQRLGVDYRSRHTFEPKPWSIVKKGYTHFADGDVLLARITPSFENGKAGIVRDLPNGIGAGSTEYFVCRPLKGVLLPEYLLAHFKTPQFLRDGEQVMSGAVGQQRVPKQYVLDSELRLAPFNEQKRIADKLDAVLAQVDACRERLDRVPAILKRFRQTVLTAAAAGKLTEEWREAHDVSLISKAKESVTASREGLPPGWWWSCPEEIKARERYSLAIGPFGSNLKVKDYRPTGVPLVFVKEIRTRNFGGLGTKFISEEKALELAAHTISGGDLLITKMGDPPGDTAIYPKGAPDAVITADCIKLRVRALHNRRLALSAFDGSPYNSHPSPSNTRSSAASKPSSPTPTVSKPAILLPALRLSA